MNTHDEGKGIKVLAACGGVDETLDRSRYCIRSSVGKCLRA